MELLALENQVLLGLHYDNLASLIAECKACAAESSDVAVGYYVIGSVLNELMYDMDHQAVLSSALLSIEISLTPHLTASLKALRSGSKEASWIALNSLISAWNKSSSESVD
jgi:hypothetical protein